MTLISFIEIKVERQLISPIARHLSNFLFSDTIVFVVWTARLLSAGYPNIGTTLDQFCCHDRAMTG